MPLGPELGCGVSGLRDVYLEVGGVAMGEAGEVDGKPDPRAACVQRERETSTLAPGSQVKSSS